MSAFAHLVAGTAPVDPNEARCAALGTAYGQITYAMHCLRQGYAHEAFKALETGEAAVREVSPNLSDFWATFPAVAA